MKIQGKTFVVTGGASGLGAATAAMLVENGGNVVIADMNRALGEEFAAKLGAQARFAETNVADEASAQAALDVAVNTFGGLHGLINCAGIGTAEKIVGKTGPHRLDSFSRVIQVNLIGTFNMMRLAAARMATNEPQDGERGVIINTASVAAFEGQIGQSAYSASKGGVVAMTLPAARELAREAIRVLTIAPGLMETPMLLGMPAEVQESLARTVTFPQRLGRPAEYAGLVKHIVENGYLNGEVIRLDGAIRMAAK